VIKPLQIYKSFNQYLKKEGLKDIIIEIEILRMF